MRLRSSLACQFPFVCNPIGLRPKSLKSATSNPPAQTAILTGRFVIKSSRLTPSLWSLALRKRRKIVSRCADAKPGVPRRAIMADRQSGRLRQHLFPSLTERNLSLNRASAAKRSRAACATGKCLQLAPTHGNIGGAKQTQNLCNAILRARQEQRQEKNCKLLGDGLD
jgi:hypothetical protein